MCFMSGSALSRLLVPCMPLFLFIFIFFLFIFFFYLNWQTNKPCTEAFKLVVQFRVHISHMRTSTGLRTSHVAANSKVATLYDVRI